MIQKLLREREEDIEIMQIIIKPPRVFSIFIYVYVAWLRCSIRVIPTHSTPH